MRTKLGRAPLAAVLGIALVVFLIAVNAPLWLFVLALLAWAAVYWRYRWRMGLREEMIEARDHGLARGLEKRRLHLEKKRKRRSGSE